MEISKGPGSEAESLWSCYYRDGPRILSTNIYFVIALVFALSLCVGVSFYSHAHDWELSTSFYFASQVLLGNMYNIPEELDAPSQAFTMIYFLWGTCLIACFHLIATASVGSSSAAMGIPHSHSYAHNLNSQHFLHQQHQQHQHYQQQQQQYFPQHNSESKLLPTSTDAEIGFTSDENSSKLRASSVSQSPRYPALRLPTISPSPSVNNIHTSPHHRPPSSPTPHYLHQQNHAIREEGCCSFFQRHTRLCCLLICMLWVFLGTVYGVYVEEWSVLRSLYFAIGAMSAAGVPSPSCLNGDDEFPLATCQLGAVRGLVLGVYLIVGVPLFAFTVGLLSGHIVDNIYTANERRVIARMQSFNQLPQLQLGEGGGERGGGGGGFDIAGISGLSRGYSGESDVSDASYVGSLLRPRYGRGSSIVRGAFLESEEVLSVEDGAGREELRAGPAAGLSGSDWVLLELMRSGRVSAAEVRSLSDAAVHNGYGSTNLTLHSAALHPTTVYGSRSHMNPNCVPRCQSWFRCFSICCYCCPTSSGKRNEEISPGVEDSNQAQGSSSSSSTNSLDSSLAVFSSSLSRSMQNVVTYLLSSSCVSSSPSSTSSSLPAQSGDGSASMVAGGGSGSGSWGGSGSMNWLSWTRRMLLTPMLLFVFVFGCLHVLRSNSAITGSEANNQYSLVNLFAMMMH